MVRVITQETYDEVVKENMEEFEMSPEEAIKEAVAQFQAQGVDLSNIIKDLVLSSDEEHPVTSAINKLKDYNEKGVHDEKAISKELDTLRSECAKDLARRVRAGKDGAYPLLISLLEARLNTYLDKESEKDKLVIVNVLKTLTALMDTQPDLLDDKGVDLIKCILDTIMDKDILIGTLKWTATSCVKHEMNRQRLFAKNIADNLKKFIENKSNVRLIAASMQVVRRLTLDDDIRVEFGKAHDHAKELAVKLLTPLTEMLNADNSDLNVTLDILKTISPLLVRHELCALVAEKGICDGLFDAIATYHESVILVQQALKLYCSEHKPNVHSKFVTSYALVAEKGICDGLFDVIASYHKSVILVQQALKLVTALAGNDDVKRQLMECGIAPMIVTVMTRHTKNALAAALALKSIAALTLREPTHSCMFFDSGAVELIVDCMKQHPDDASVQKNACWAIRNMVARFREQNHRFVELGAEALLNQAYNKFEKQFGFDIKSALRDLECDVKLDEQWRGTGAEIDQ